MEEWSKSLLNEGEKINKSYKGWWRKYSWRFFWKTGKPSVSKGLPSTEVELAKAGDDFSKAQDERALLLKHLCLNPAARRHRCVNVDGFWGQIPHLASGRSCRHRVSSKQRPEESVSTQYKVATWRTYSTTEKCVISRSTETRVPFNLNKAVCVGRGMKHVDHREKPAGWRWNGTLPPLN